MEKTAQGIWPDGVPTSLWNLDLLQPEQQRLVPFMGLNPQDVLPWFLAGAAIIAVFAWKQFGIRTFDPDQVDYRVLRELAPTQLRGRSPILWAYAYYVAILVVVLFIMTFFGDLVAEAFAAVNVAGLQVDVAPQLLSSPGWPVVIALSFVGLAPLIKPLDKVEVWLRRRAHEWVGIPVRIRQNTNRFLESFGGKTVAGSAPDPSALPPWARVHLDQTDSAARVLELKAQLEALVRWTRGQLDWPSHVIEHDLRKLEEVEATEADDVLQDFDELLARDYDAAPSEGIRGLPDGSDDERRRAYRRQMEDRLTKIVGRMERLRGELASIFAVYAERDNDFRKVKDDGLKRILEGAFPPLVVYRGPDQGVLALLAPVFLLYALACTLQYHSLLTGVDRVLVTVLLTATLETTRLAMLFWLPLLGAFFWRNYRCTSGQWVSMRRDNISAPSLRQAIFAAMIALCISLVGVTLLTLLWAALISPNPTRFQEILFSGNPSFFVYFITQTGVSVLFTLCVLFAADDLAQSSGASVRPGRYGATCAILVVGYMIVHGYSMNGPCSLQWYPDCLRWYNVTDLICYAVVGYLTPTLFVASGSPQAPKQPTGLKVAATAGVVLLALMLTTGKATAGRDLPQLAGKGETVVVGFRVDAEPFSYAIKVDGETRFVGYIADLCYRVLAGTDYEVVPVAVTSRDRFDRLRTNKWSPYDPADEKPEIDLLCDPVTLRFSNPDQRANGIFSPIVFASGVSYILRSTRSSGSDAYLGYLANSTAWRVAEQACNVDLLNVWKGGAQREQCDNPPRIPAERAQSGAPDDCRLEDETEQSSAEASYRFCVLDSHTELIEWFCDQSEASKRVKKAYFGDRDIVLGKLRVWREENPCPIDEIEKQNVSYTYEPYALVVTKTKPDLVQHVQRRIYEFFSHPAEATSLFRTYFPDQQMSAPLASLFLMNAVTEPSVFTRQRPPGEGPGDSDPAPSESGNITAAGTAKANELD